MIKIMFVCLGNICRSPMAEFVFKDMIKKKGLENNFLIKSSATSGEELGNDIHYGTTDKLLQKGIPFEKRKSTLLKKEDYEEYDYIIGMEDRNVLDIFRIVNEDSEGKVFKLLDFTNNSRDIADPWYTGNFEKTYNDILEGCEGFLNFLLK